MKSLTEMYSTPKNPMILLQSRELSGPDCNQAGKEPKKGRVFMTLNGLTISLIQCLRKPNGSLALVYWIAKDILTETVETTVSLRIKKEALPGEVRIADLLTGDIYSIPENILNADDDGYLYFKNLPATDSPLMITFGDFY